MWKRYNQPRLNLLQFPFFCLEEPNMRPCSLLFIFAATLLFAVSVTAQDRETKVRNDRKNVEEAGRWIYNDLPKGIAEAKQTGKPLLVIFRCIPCEACAQLDSQV